MICKHSNYYLKRITVPVKQYIIFTWSELDTNTYKEV